MSTAVRSSVIALAVALVLVAGATGCSRAPKASSGTGGLPEATSSVPASPAPDAVEDPSGDTTSDGQVQETPKDAPAVIKELEAIERELSGMDLPSEQDFDSLEGEIR